MPTTQTEQDLFHNFNHNGTWLGGFTNEREAQADAREYMYQTGNVAMTVRKDWLTPEQLQEIRRG